MLAVTHKGRSEPFDKRRLARWIAHRFAIDPRAAIKISRTVRQVATARGLDAIAVGEIQPLTYTVIGQALIGGLGPRAFAFDPLDYLPDASDATDLIKSVLGWLIEELGDQGWEKDGPGSLKREQVGFVPPFDDQKAPDLQNLEITAYDCRRKAGQRGIEVTFSMEVSDTGGVGNSSGVTSVKVCGLQVASDGTWLPGPCATVRLSDADEDRSEDEFVPVEVSLCFDCAYADVGILPFYVEVTDADDNGRIRASTIPFGMDIRSRCCGESQDEGE